MIDILYKHDKNLNDEQELSFVSEDANFTGITSIILVVSLYNFAYTTDVLYI